MSLPTKTTEMLPGIHWTGVIDWGIRSFHGYKLDGTSYNSFFIDDEHKTLVDTVKAPFASNLIDRVAAITPLDEVKYIIMNHAEGDHSSALPLVIPHMPNATIVTNKKCRQHLELLYGDSLSSLPDERWKIVGASDTLDIGSRELHFVMTPMLHWPDSMMTYSPHDKALFSMDGFGQHIASSLRWADEVGLDKVLDLGQEYVANILGLFPAQVRKALKVLGTVDVENILCAHGACWRGMDVQSAVAMMKAFGEGTQLRPKVSILYETMYGSTEKLATAMSEGAQSVGAEVIMMDLKVNHITRLAREVYDSAAVGIGSPTLNNGVMPNVSAALTYLKGLTLLRGKPVAAFGAYGWAQRSVNDIYSFLETCRCDVLGKPGIAVKFTPDDDAMKQAYEMGQELGRRAVATVEKMEE
eukprot:gnl/Dysnectes_brevis/507_a563_5249.p1 GENE.gnl/Dysnectes_brevis/507_a563_5249~~gnl/Dysnectes_brevis/507_a563_5249.p1  ORF type:complete len:413 (-),score=129.52 gnl/Dysnectes_brevis/507_a563_5249:32-1270(-)